MQGHIEKTAKDVFNYKSPFYFYESARKGFSNVLSELNNGIGDFTLLLPSYIGYSPNEGSGIIDPIKENNVKHVFYPIDLNIEVDLSEFEKVIQGVSGRIVVLIVHYFGFVDPNINSIIKIARNYNALIIEDCAHALYSDFIDHSCGHLGDISIYSLHKMLPFENGGMVRLNDFDLKLSSDNSYDVFSYDLYSIAQKRKKLASIIERELSGVPGIRALRNIDQYQNCTPQTYPIVLEAFDKDELYHLLNNSGYGVVSLYHTMIKELEEYDDSVLLSHSILNLPTHQDAREDQVVAMCKLIRETLKKD